MKKLQYNEYGGPEQLEWVDVPVPELKDNEVLVQVKAAGINPTDTKLRNGEMKFFSMFSSFPRGMGLDFAGVITAVGKDVTQHKAGDKVYGGAGMTGGSFADYIKADAAKVFPMPANLSFAEASTIVLNGGTAIVTVNHFVAPKPGMTVLVNGAGGGVGLFIMQLCKVKGATVSAVAAPESKDQLAALGADEALDYKTTNVLTAGKLYDYIVDASGKMKFDDAKEILTEHGTFCTLTPDMASLGGQVSNVFRGKKEKNMLSQASEADMEEFVGLITAGLVKCVVGQTFPMAEAIEVQKKQEAGGIRTTGKVVLTAD